MPDPIKLPVTLYGSVVGDALVNPDGKIVINIDDTPKGKEMYDILTLGFIDHLTVVPQNYFIPRKNAHVPESNL
jgi:hypothetical protein